MIIKPKVRGFVCVTAHPVGCAENIQEQIEYVKREAIADPKPKKVLIIGSSTGYGLSSRITSAFGCGADTLGVYFERTPAKGRLGTAGWYNNYAVERAAEADGLYAKSINGDAFSDEVKQQVIEMIQSDMGKVDLIIYSLASPRRTHPKTGEVFKSVLKPVGESFTANNLNTDKHEISPVTIEPASEEEIANTVTVMGGEDWEMWIEALNEAGVIADGATSVAYSYLGPEATWPIYKNGTIGQAKDHLLASSKKIDAVLKEKSGRAFVSVNKAVVTQASSAIPVVPLYISVLFKVMKAKGIQEGCTEQIHRLFRDFLYGGAELKTDELGRIRVDDWEMRDDVQKEVAEIMPQITTENLRELADYDGYQEEFLKLFGFSVSGVDYEEDVDLLAYEPVAT